MPDFARLAETAERLIEKNGRAITIVKLSLANDDNAKPWRGTATPRSTPEASEDVFGVFVPLSTNQYLGIADSQVQDVNRGEQVCLVAANAASQDIKDFNEIVDDDGTRWRIVRAQLLRPGVERLLYAFEVKR